MSEILRAPNGNAVMLTPRTGSHSLALAAMQTFWPELPIGDGHPARYFGVQEFWDGTNPAVAIVVRNPISRFRSMCAHRPELAISEHLAQPVYGPLPQCHFARYFRFEDQLEECAEWLGLPTPLPHIDASIESNKPVLTLDQETTVRQIYANDIVLWESLKEI